MLFKNLFQRVKYHLNSKKNDIIEVILLIPTFTLFNLITQNIISCVNTEGPSMFPTIQDGNILLVDHLFFKYFGVKQGDIIVAQSPLQKNIQICKRLIHLPGEKYSWTDNDQYKQNITIPKNHYWIEGDNKEQSFDSRQHGPIPKQLIKGKVLLSLYPLKTFY